MEQIVPINEETCTHFIGVPVCAVLNDGNRHFGIISKVRKGKLILNDSSEDESSGAVKRSKGEATKTTAAKTRKTPTSRKSKRGLQLSAFPPEAPAEHFEPFETLEPRSPFGAKVSVDLANIAGLFPLL
ncbi:hypothetical protein [Paenibacillus ginsengarvi]|uniref:Uncharacterized protein n=1 Tax=Paenibacillus ginsengarvi TaxID=400777 RepID=A0A3B0AZY3_9BACL|nr:hypothetical protein [Paenibacillus ginsengarvi]RKN65477.1 hypothetical protein D7M11_32475 [Paenibacillus ginsengarvi]